MEEIEVLRKMIDNNSFSSEVLISILKSFDDDVALIPLLLLKDQKIIRSRLNEKDLFYNVSELSYPPASCVNRTDRASLKGHPMFYGSVFTKDAEKTGCLPRIVSAMETLGIFKDTSTYKQCIFTQSVWFIEEDAHLFAFPVSDKYKRSCSDLNFFKKDGWETYCKDEFSEKSIAFFTFIGDLMATQGTQCLYDITATCIDYIIKSFSFEGIVYPSVPSEGEGMNICLTPKTVDEKVSFGGAVTETVIKNGKDSTIESFAKSEMVSSTSFQWILTKYGKKILTTIGGHPHFEDNDRVILAPNSK